MSLKDQQLSERLGAAFEIEMTDEVRTRQLSAISGALLERPSEVLSSPSLLTHWRRRLAALVAATAIFAPAAVAVAAEGTLPGDVLYPVKQITEEVRSVVDPMIIATHRIDEADRMHEMGFPLDKLEIVLIKADNAVMKVGDPEMLRSRLADVRERMGMDHAVEEMSESDLQRDRSPITDPHDPDAVTNHDSGDMMRDADTTTGDEGTRMGDTDSTDTRFGTNDYKSPSTSGTDDAETQSSSDSDGESSTGSDTTTATTMMDNTSSTTWDSGSDSSSHDRGDTSHDTGSGDDWSP
ncbi:MAG: hypothetical protein M3112_05970 [Actinomycetia bacterium]|nr:hypothetical protein [Actinomycetes bacterium]